MEKLELIYEGKAKQVYKTKDNDKVIIHYKDDATAFNGIKKASIQNKGILNNKISSVIYEHLNSKGIKTHYMGILNDRDVLCQKVNIIPLEVIVRNVAAGSFSKRLGIEEGTVLSISVFELCYKNDDLGDPIINDYHAEVLNIASNDELKIIYEIAKHVNKILKELFDNININLIDFKMEFGKDAEGNIILADEISPDTARLWDKKTNDKLDKDRFRRDLGKIEEAYQEILNRLEKTRV